MSDDDVRAIQVQALMDARDAARANWHTVVNDGRDEHTRRHWSATAGWLKHRADDIAAGREPDWPDASTSPPALDGPGERRYPLDWPK